MQGKYQLSIQDWQKMRNDEQKAETRKFEMIRLLLIFCLSMVFSRCSKDNKQTFEPDGLLDLNQLTFSHSEKGWELYSWPNSKDWNYSILMGTNRLKTYDEVKTNNIIVSGIDSLKLVLAKFPKGELITWIGPGWLTRCWVENFYDLSLPPKEIVDEIKLYCSEINLILQVTE